MINCNDNNTACENTKLCEIGYECAGEKEMRKQCEDGKIATTVGTVSCKENDYNVIYDWQFGQTITEGESLEYEIKLPSSPTAPVKIKIEILPIKSNKLCSINLPAHTFTSDNYNIPVTIQLGAAIRNDPYTYVNTLDTYV